MVDSCYLLRVALFSFFSVVLFVFYCFVLILLCLFIAILPPFSLFCLLLFKPSLGRELEGI